MSACGIKSVLQNHQHPAFLDCCCCVLFMLHSWIILLFFFRSIPSFWQRGRRLALSGCWDTLSMWPQQLLALPTKVRQDGFKKAAVEEERQTNRHSNRRQIGRKMMDIAFDAEFENLNGKNEISFISVEALSVWWLCVVLIAAGIRLSA